MEDFGHDHRLVDIRSAEGADRKEEETVADDREAQIDEKDVEAHGTIDSPGVDRPGIDRSDEGDDVEAHALIDRPGVDRPGID